MQGNPSASLSYSHRNCLYFLVTLLPYSLVSTAYSSSCFELTLARVLNGACLTEMVREGGWQDHEGPTYSHMHTITHTHTHGEKKKKKKGGIKKHAHHNMSYHQPIIRYSGTRPDENENENKNENENGNGNENGNENENKNENKNKNKNENKNENENDITGRASFVPKRLIESQLKIYVIQLWLGKLIRTMNHYLSCCGEFSQLFLSRSFRYTSSWEMLR